jgi:hypothetical protein
VLVAADYLPPSNNLKASNRIQHQGRLCCLELEIQCGRFDDFSSNGQAPVELLSVSVHYLKVVNRILDSTLIGIAEPIEAGVFNLEIQCFRFDGQRWKGQAAAELLILSVH